MTSYESYSRRSNSPYSTTPAAFQPPAYQQMAAATAANGQDYYQHQHQQPMLYMPPVSHNPPNPLQPTVMMDHAQAQSTGLVAVPSPQSQSVSPGREPSSAPTLRALNNSKRAEQNRKAQRAFRERRDAHIKYLESRSELLDAALQQAEESNRRWEEARGVMEALKRENEILRRALAQYNQTSHPGALGSLALPPHNPPPLRPLPSAQDHHPLLSVAPTEPGFAHSVRALQERARVLKEEGARMLKEEGARIEKIQVGVQAGVQAGARKRRRAAAPVPVPVPDARDDAGEDADQAQVLTATNVPAGKRKRPRAAHAQDAS